MTRERLIYRPNAIAPDDWDAMNRDEQIAWWRAHTKAFPQPKRHMKEAISLYHEGKFPLLTFVSLVIERAAADEIEEFLCACPAELLAAVKESLAGYGDDESTWPRLIIFGGTYVPWVTHEEIEESRRQELQRIFDGVRLLKKCGLLTRN